jgi:hypothetical protein
MGASAREARLQQEIGEPVEQRLQVYCIGELRIEAGVGMEADKAALSCQLSAIG